MNKNVKVSLIFLACLPVIMGTIILAQFIEIKWLIPLLPLILITSFFCGYSAAYLTFSFMKWVMD